jgi:hypothetical protein
MSGCEEHLDRAMEILASEMDALREEDVDEAHRLALARGDALHNGCAQLTGADKTEALVHKLEQLKTMHTGLISEALRIQERVREDLLRLRSERQRFAGYRDARKVTPLISRFVSKQG